MLQANDDGIITKYITIPIDGAYVGNEFFAVFIIREIMFHILQALFYFFFIGGKIFKNYLCCIINLFVGCGKTMHIIGGTVGRPFGI